MRWTDGFTVFDIETTGLDPDTDGIVELGAARFSGNRGEQVSLFTAADFVPREAYDVHGISHLDLKDAPPLAQAWGQLALVGPTVSYNGIDFDIPFLRAKLGDGILPQLKPHLDVFVFIQWHFRHWWSRKLSSACDRFGLKPKSGDLHRAAVDCELTGQLLLKLIEIGVVPDDIDESRRRMQLFGRAIQEERILYGPHIYEDRTTGELRYGTSRQHIGKKIEDVPQKEWKYIRDKHKFKTALIEEMARDSAGDRQGKAADDRPDPDGAGRRDHRDDVWTPEL